MKVRRSQKFKQNRIKVTGFDASKMLIYYILKFFDEKKLNYITRVYMSKNQKFHTHKLPAAYQFEF